VTADHGVATRASVDARVGGRRQPAGSVSYCIVPAILFRCPNTGHRVQGWIAEDVSDADENTYQSVTCLACQQVHLVNPKSEKVFGALEE
jgi:hypothetical protein